jgi:hypothetical protein
VLDGELTMLVEGRLSFDALQRRMVTAPSKARALVKAVPAALVAFDLLGIGGVDLRTQRWTVRRGRLEQLADRWTPPLQISPVTDDLAEAQEWFEVLPEAMGIDGLVVKAAITCARARQVSEVLGWLEQFEGNTWEQRWLASGADAAPTTWRQAVRPNGSGAGVGAAMNALMVARLLRPLYGWQLTTRARFHLSSRMLEVNDAEALGRLRRLPVYQRALLRHQFDAEACLSRVMIRTGRTLEQLQGDDLLHYADVVKTSGRTRREHPPSSDEAVSGGAGSGSNCSPAAAAALARR